MYMCWCVCVRVRVLDPRAFSSYAHWLPSTDCAQPPFIFISAILSSCRLHPSASPAASPRMGPFQTVDIPCNNAANLENKTIHRQAWVAEMGPNASLPPVVNFTKAAGNAVVMAI